LSPDAPVAPRPRISALDVLIAALASVLGVWMMAINLSWDDVPDVSPLALPAIFAVTLPLVWRSVAPLPALAAATAALTAHVVLFGGLVRCGLVFPVAWVFAFALGARLERRDARAGLALVLVFELVMALDDGVVGPEVLVLFGPLTWAVWRVGRVVHERGVLVAELQARTAELREARDERARLEVATDRARLSGELDRLLQHRLGELAALADRGRDTPEPEAAHALLVEIEQASRRTLDEMRSVVGVLREDGQAPVAPQPTLTRLDRLLAEAGGHARLRIEGSPRVLPAGVELSAYRVIEQLLTALDAAGDLDVCVAFGDDALELRVSGPAQRRAGAAIERARERVELHRGTLVADLREGRAEAVAQLPLLVPA
jgi:signal transduction histidine kinase